MPSVPPRRFCCFAVAAGMLLLGGRAAAEPVRFRTDVMAVLSKAGCNQGTCHGNLNGKNGFKLSLRGDDPDADFLALTRDTLARRTNPQHPGDSLILLKATAAIPHEGGRRFGTDALEYQILRRWITAGLPADPPDLSAVRRIDVSPSQQVLVDPAQGVQLRVEAAFSDGSRRDVTRLASYETSNAAAIVTAEGRVQRRQMGETTVLVRYLDQRAAAQLAFIPDRPALTAEQIARAWGGQAPTPAQLIDYHVAKKLQSLRMLPSPLCSDGVFLRRVYLDTLGIVPTAAEACAFLDDTRPDKRARLIEHLLRRPEFDDFWAQKWADLLRSEEKVLDRKGVQVFYQWIRQAVAEDRPLNEFARQLVAGRGSTYSNPPANFYRALREPDTRAEAVGQVFLGVRLQCAHCHNHPFDRWTQNDYHSLAAFFPRIQYRIVENNRKDRLDKHEFDGEQIVWLDREGEVKHPRTGAVVAPRFLGAATPAIPASADRLQVLADWIAAPDNPLFARTQVNRIWYHLLGQGIVDPPDDFRASNPPVNGPLLEALGRDFAAHGFSLRHTVRTILNSRTYQLAARPTETNGADEANFAHAVVRPLQAEQLLDAVSQVAGVPVPFEGYPPGTRAGQLPGPRTALPRGQALGEGERFLKVFGKPERLLSCECERSTDTTVNQAFAMLTGPLLNELIRTPHNRLGRLLAAGRSDRAIIEELYLAALSRPPHEGEWRPAVAYVAKAKDRRQALEDVLWALLNAKEFLFRQ